MKVFEDASISIGNTPLVELHKVAAGTKALLNKYFEPYNEKLYKLLS